MNALMKFAEPRAPASIEIGGAAAARSTWICDFVINGRFLSQPVTGVQRYAREITAAMDVLLRDGNGEVGMISPRHVTLPGDHVAVRMSRAGLMQGHIWEQLELPLLADRPILSLCNTGPVRAVGQVVCIHDANVFREPESYSFGFRSAYKALLPRLAKNARLVTTVSQSSREDIASHLAIAKDKIIVIPNGHEHAFRWRASRSALAQTTTLNRPFVFLLGSRARHKNIGVILQLADALDSLGLDLVVAGGGASIYAGTSQVQHPQIRWLGRVTDDDLAFLYSRALCLAFPSRFEGFGLPLVEAMALGCPVVSSNTGSMLEVCGKAALLASPDDPSAWLAHVSALVASPALRTDLAERGRQRVKRFSWAESARAYLHIHGHG